MNIQWSNYLPGVVRKKLITQCAQIDCKYNVCLYEQATCITCTQTMPNSGQDEHHCMYTNLYSSGLVCVQCKVWCCACTLTICSGSQDTLLSLMVSLGCKCTKDPQQAYIVLKFHCNRIAGQKKKTLKENKLTLKVWAQA